MSNAVAVRGAFAGPYVRIAVKGGTEQEGAALSRRTKPHLGYLLPTEEWQAGQDKEGGALCGTAAYLFSGMRSTPSDVYDKFGAIGKRFFEWSRCPSKLRVHGPMLRVPAPQSFVHPPLRALFRLAFHKGLPFMLKWPHPGHPRDSRAARPSFLSRRDPATDRAVSLPLRGPQTLQQRCQRGTPLLWRGFCSIFGARALPLNLIYSRQASLMQRLCAFFSITTSPTPVM